MNSSDNELNLGDDMNVIGGLETPKIQLGEQKIVPLPDASKESSTYNDPSGIFDKKQTPQSTEPVTEAGALDDEEYGIELESGNRQQLATQIKSFHLQKKGGNDYRAEILKRNYGNLIPVLSYRSIVLFTINKKCLVPMVCFFLAFFWRFTFGRYLLYLYRNASSSENESIYIVENLFVIGHLVLIGFDPGIKFVEEGEGDHQLDSKNKETELEAFGDCFYCDECGVYVKRRLFYAPFIGKCIAKKNLIPFATLCIMGLFQILFYIGGFF